MDLPTAIGLKTVALWPACRAELVEVRAPERWRRATFGDVSAISIRSTALKLNLNRTELHGDSDAQPEARPVLNLCRVEACQPCSVEVRA